MAFITDFELALVQEARRRGFDGVVCGHIHKADIRMLDGMLYCNDGDWVESLIEFKIMLRPLKAINLIHQRMAEMLQATSGRAT